jgi:hypothetical protein
MGSKPLVIEVFTPFFRIGWALAALITLLSEVSPVPVMTPFVHYGLYGPAKGLVFIVLGFLTPLAFIGLNGLNRGIVFAMVSASMIELLQRLIRSGHSFHWYELVLKIACISIGLIISLDVRYHRALSLGPFKVEIVCERIFGKRTT